MTTRPFGPSYERGRRLVDAGCPLDYLNLLPRNLAAYRKRLYLRELSGVESRIADLGAGGTGYLVGVAVGTDLPSGNIITDWRFDLPWEQHISWDSDPDQITPLQGREVYANLFNARLPRVLDERRLLTRGHPVEGLLSGHTLESIPEPFRHLPMIGAKLSLTDDTGFTIALPIQLMVDRSAAREAEAPTTKRRNRLLECPDRIVSNTVVSHNDNKKQDAEKESKDQKDTYVTNEGRKSGKSDAESTAGKCGQGRRSRPFRSKRGHRPRGAKQPLHQFAPGGTNSGHVCPRA